MHLLPLALLATTATAHIVLNLPTSFGFDDDKETTGPCGSFNPMNRTTVTQWPINGGAVAVLQADKSANLTFNFLMAASTSNVMIVPAMKINVAGTGDVCMPVVAPPASITSMSGMSTVGMPAVLQVVGETDDGKLYQCAALAFAAAATTRPAPPAACKNATGVKITMLPLPASTSVNMTGGGMTAPPPSTGPAKSDDR